MKKGHETQNMARFKSGSFDFVLLTIHTDPDEATLEIRLKISVFILAKQQNEFYYIID